MKPQIVLFIINENNPPFKMTVFLKYNNKLSLQVESIPCKSQVYRYNQFIPIISF